MNQETLKALELSIVKWDLICHGVKIDRGTGNCPLCKKFYRHSEKCHGCPVHKITRQIDCKHTPYWEYAHNFDSFSQGMNKAFNIEQACDGAEAEVEFLISLLPANHLLRRPL